MYSLLRHILFRLDAETAHGIVSQAARFAHQIPGCSALMRRRFGVTDPRLEVTLGDLRFSNPVGLAAGFDKHGLFVGPAADLGFGFVEVGSVTARASLGNPRPRLFRLPKDRALINRMGLNNPGPQRLVDNLPSNRPFPVAISVAKTNDSSICDRAVIDDFLESVRIVAPHADMLVIDVSCPNSGDGTMLGRDPQALHELLQGIDALSVAAPVFIKLSPDLTDAELVAALGVILERKVAGVVLTNSSVSRQGLLTPADVVSRIGRGGLSGRPIRAVVTAMIRRVYREVGSKLAIIGVGGIDSAETAFEKIRAGARLVELYTGLVYNGPSLVATINRGLLGLLEREGLKSIEEAIGSESQS